MGKWYKDGDLYQPSNGTEGMSFISEYCDNCIHECPLEESDKKCDILTRSMVYSITDHEYPRQWQYKNDKPICTDFVKWDWGNDGDPDDRNNPKAPPPPPDPRQLNLFPLYPNENYFKSKITDYKKKLNSYKHMKKLLLLLALLTFMSCATTNRGYHKQVRTKKGVIYPAQKKWINAFENDRKCLP